MVDFDPKNIDPTKAFTFLNDMNKALSGITGNLKPQGVIDSMTIKKSYPITFSGKKGVLNVTKDNSMTLKIEGITDEEIKELLRRVHD